MHILDNIKIGRRGGVSAKIVINGKQGHPSYPQKASNPIHPMVNALNEIITTTLDHGSEFFDPSTLQILRLHSDQEGLGLIPGRCIADIRIRYADVSTIDSIEQFLRTIIVRHTNSFDLNMSLSSEPFVSHDNNMVPYFIDTITNLYNIVPTTSTGGGGSDAHFFKNYSCHVLECGPISATAHQANEHIAIDDLQKLYITYRESLKSYLGEVI